MLQQPARHLVQISRCRAQVLQVPRLSVRRDGKEPQLEGAAEGLTSLPQSKLLLQLDQPRQVGDDLLREIPAPPDTDASRQETLGGRERVSECPPAPVAPVRRPLHAEELDLADTHPDLVGPWCVIRVAREAPDAQHVVGAPRFLVGQLPL